MWTGLRHWPLLVTPDGAEITKLGLSLKLKKDIEALVCESTTTIGGKSVVRNSTAVVDNKEIVFNVDPEPKPVPPTDQDLGLIKLHHKLYHALIGLSSFAVVFAVAFVAFQCFYFCSNRHHRGCCIVCPKARKGKKMSIINNNK